MQHSTNIKIVQTKCTLPTGGAILLEDYIHHLVSLHVDEQSAKHLIIGFDCIKS